MALRYGWLKVYHHGCLMSVDPAFLQTALEIASRAGAIQQTRRSDDVRVDKKSPIDLVTQVDVEIETFCRELIAERFSDHAVLAEELPNCAETAHGASDCCWIIDPIDGTVNYAHGLPLYCCSVALEVAGELEIGVVFDPNRDELFVAERGAGARLNGSPIAVSSKNQMIDAMLCTGFPYDVHSTIDEVVGLFGAFVARARAVRRLGSAALDLCYLAAGRFDGFWEQRLHPWDTAAGVLMIKEAGGRVTGLEGNPFAVRDENILASNGPLHDSMLMVAREFDRRRSGKRTD